MTAAPQHGIDRPTGPPPTQPANAHRLDAPPPPAAHERPRPPAADDQPRGAPRLPVAGTGLRWLTGLASVALLMLLIASPARAAGLLIADGGLGGVLEIEEHDVRVVVNNGIAVTTVTQVFRNTEDRQVEALYTFPVPKGASVANFSMWINGKEMVGEVLEKKRAREIYNSYKSVRRDPGLLEQTDYRTFEMRIFPIAARAEQRVQVCYYQELDVDHDWATYVYPLATATRQVANTRTTGRFALTLDVKSAVPIAAMESTSHANDFAIAKHDPAYYQASLEQRAGDLNRDVVVAYHLSRPKTGVDLITSKQGKEDGYFQLTLTAGDELAPKGGGGMDYVFLLDVSGSMNNDGKLALSRNALAGFVETLRPEDRFELMTFNVQPNALFARLTAADEAGQRRASQFLDAQQARGGTVLAPALTGAYRYADPERPLNVLVISDGMTEQAERREMARLIAQRPKGARVFCIGVGNDVDRGLLDQLARDSGGLAAYLSKEDNFARQAAAFKRKLMHPVATELAVKIDGDAEVYDLEPRTLPSLYHGMPVRLYGRYRGAGPVKVSLSASVDGRPLTQSVPMDLPASDASNPEVERMWAWHKVDRLLNADRSTGSSGALDEIVRLGEAYSIVTEYTSFIVLENDAEYTRWKIDRRNQLRLGRDRAAQDARAAQLDAIRDKAASNIGPVAAADQAKVDVPAAASPSSPRGSTPVSAPQSPAPGNNNGNSRDFNVPTGKGGGAFDPVTGAIVLLLGGAAFAARRRTGSPVVKPREFRE